MVLDGIEEKIFAPKARSSLVEKLFEFHKNRRKDEESKVEYAKKEYARIQRAIDNLLRIIEQGKATDSVIDQLNQREKEKAILAAEVDRLERQKTLNLSRKEVEAYIENCYQQLIKARQEEDDEQLKPIVQKFVEKVVIYEEEIEIVLKITLVTEGGGGPYLTVTKVIKHPPKNNRPPATGSVLAVQHEKKPASSSPLLRQEGSADPMVAQREESCQETFAIIFRPPRPVSPKARRST